MGRTAGARSATTEVKVAAVRLVGSGMTQTAVARAFGVDQSTVSRWCRLARSGGLNALLRRPRAGRPRRLPDRDLRRLRSRLALPPSAQGLRGSRWTLALLAELIRRTTGVSYHPSHVSRRLRDSGIRYD